MKRHFLLIIALLAFSLSASAERRTVDYQFSGNVPGWDGMEYVQDYAVEVSFDDAAGTVTLHSPFPKTKPDVSCTGNITEGIITFPQNVCYQLSYFGQTIDYQLGMLDGIETDGRYVFCNPRDAQLTIDSNGIITSPAITDSLQPFLCLFRYSPEGNIEVCDYVANLVLTPVETGELVVVPKTAVTVPYIYYFTDDSYVPHAVEGTVAVDGSDYYFDRLTVTGATLKGSLQNDRVTIPKGQYLGRQNGKMRYAAMCHFPDKPDAEGLYTPTLTDITLTYNAGNKTFALPQPLDNCVCDYVEGESYSNCLWDFVLKPYPGDAPATPSSPYDLSIQDLGEEKLFVFKQNNIDTDGNYLKPAQLSFTFFLDDEEYIFTPSAFPGINEDCSVVSYGKSAGDGIVWNNGTMMVYFPEDLFDTIGVRTCYSYPSSNTAESSASPSEDRYSPIISVDMEGNTYTDFRPDEVESVSSVGAPLSTSPAPYDLSGRRVAPHSLALPWLLSRFR